jgi:hypothetical protein
VGLPEIVPAIAVVRVALPDEALGAVYLAHVPEVPPEDEEDGDPEKVGGEGECGEEREDEEVLGRARQDLMEAARPSSDLRVSGLLARRYPACLLAIARELVMVHGLAMARGLEAVHGFEVAHEFEVVRRPVVAHRLVVAHVPAVLGLDLMVAR